MATRGRLPKTSCRTVKWSLGAGENSQRWSGNVANPGRIPHHPSRVKECHTQERCDSDRLEGILLNILLSKHYFQEVISFKSVGGVY